MGLCQAIFDCQIASFLSQRCGFEDQFPGSSDPSLGGHSGTSPKDRCGSDTSHGAASATGEFAHHFWMVTRA